MADTREALEKRFPRLSWEPDGDHWVGSLDSVNVRVDADEFAGAHVHGWISGTDIAVGCTAADPVAAVEKLAAHDDFTDALSPVRVVEYARYPDAPVRVERDMFTPGPAALGCPLAWMAILGLFMAAAGVVCFGYWSGGVQW
jgi:hypothetical protein